MAASDKFVRLLKEHETEGPGVSHLSWEAMRIILSDPRCIIPFSLAPWGSTLLDTLPLSPPPPEGPLS